MANKAEHADFLEHYRPREQEGNFEVEQDEKDGNEVVADIKLHAGVFERLKATLVGRQFRRIGTVRPQQETDQHGSHTNQEPDDDEQHDGKIILQHESSRLPLKKGGQKPPLF